MDFSILIGGDLVPTKSNEEEFSNGNLKDLVDKGIAEVLETAGFRIFNLETPLTNNKKPIQKEGPNFIAKTTTVNGIKSLQTDLVTIANNHILDQDEQGLRDTIDCLNEFNIAYVGGGNCLQEANRPYIIKHNELRIGVYACVEHEYTIATFTKGGANPFDPLESLDHIQKLSLQCDYTIVLYHGGKEFYRYPTPYLQKVCRKIIEKGADIVICQHSHCIGCYENYNGGTIVYGQGNFIFDLNEPENNIYYQTSLLVKLNIQENMTISYIPIIKNGKGIQLAMDREKEEILNSFYYRSEQLKEQGFIENQFKKLALQKGSRYLIRYSKIGSILSAMDMRLFKGKILDRPLGYLLTHRQKKTIENTLQCEVHRELLLQYLELEAEKSK